MNNTRGSNKILISVIIVNYNTAPHLRNCLNSIYKFTNIIEFEVVVVDNNSTDRDIESFPKTFPEVKFYFRNSNNGFGAACNFGAAHSGGIHLLFLNPDVILVEEGSI